VESRLDLAKKSRPSQSTRRLTFRQVVRRESYADSDRHFSPPASSRADPNTRFRESKEIRTTGGKKMSKKVFQVLFVGISIIALAGTVAAQRRIDRGERRELRADRREIRADTHEIRSDRREIYSDARERRADVREYRRDRHEGASQEELRADRPEVRSDTRELRGDRRDLGGDVRDRRGDVRDYRRDRRDARRD